MEIKVEGKNKKYCKYLMNCYCGKYSDFLTFTLFKYEYIFFNKNDNSFALNMNKLASDSLLHFDIIGKLITLLGGKPLLLLDDSINNYYIDDKTLLLEINIRLIKEKIILYTEILGKINDYYIKEILKKFIIEERKNLKIMELLQLKDKVSKQ